MVQQLYPGDGRRRFSLVDLLPNDSFGQFGQLFTFRVTTWSMFPTIRKGDRIQIGSAGELHIGDVLVFQRMGELVCHRLVGFGKAGNVYVRGDCEPGIGVGIQRQVIVGKVMAIFRRGESCSPRDIPKPSAGALLYRSLDLVLTYVSTAICRSGLKAVAVLQSSERIRRLIRWVLKSQVRFFLGFPVVLQSVQGCSRVPLPGRVGDKAWIAAVQSGRCRAKNAVLLAQIGPYWLGSIDLATPLIAIRPDVVGLGIEDLLRDLIGKLN